MIGICLNARAVELDEEVQQMHDVLIYLLKKPKGSKLKKIV